MTKSARISGRLREGVISMAEKRGQYVYNDDGTVSQLVSISGADSNGGGLGISTNEVLPVDIQARLSQTIQTHSGVSIAPSGSSGSVWIDCDGFDKLAITTLNDASKSLAISVQWSHDGVNIQGAEMDIKSTGSYLWGATITDVKSRYVKVSIYNNDTAPHTINAWIYLKA
jgi:hypothetical protein